MKIRLDSDTGGAYSYVHVDRTRRRAIKIFKRSTGEDHCRRVFASEVEAYILAASSADVAKLTPHFHGTRIIKELLAADGTDITHEIIQDCAYELDFIDGYFVKTSNAPKSEIARVEEIFNHAGIFYLIDSSCTLSVNRDIVCMIDFATTEYELWHSR
jgi:hypothetical protein